MKPSRWARIRVAIGAMGALPDILDRFIFRPLNGTKGTERTRVGLSKLDDFKEQSAVDDALREQCVGRFAARHGMSPEQARNIFFPEME